MGEPLEGRVIRLGWMFGDRIKIIDTSDSRIPTLYTAVYQNRDTRALDKRFGLTGVRVVNGDGQPYEEYKDIVRKLALATEEWAICAPQKVEDVLRYLTRVAMLTGHFFGLPEEDVRKHLTELGIDTAGIDATLTHKDFLNRGAIYLKKMKVESVAVLFPANLPYLR